MNDRLVDQVANQPLENEIGAVPSDVHRKLIELLDAVDGIDERARTLEWMMGSFSKRDRDPGRVRALREAAARFAKNASLLLARDSAEEPNSA